MSAPASAGQPSARASAKAHTRAFSVTTWRARAGTTGSSRRRRSRVTASRSGPTRPRPSRPAPGARRRPSRPACGPRRSRPRRPRPRRGRVRAGRQRAAVDEEGVALHAGGRGELVHDPGRHARGPLLGPLAGLASSSGGPLEAEGQRDGDLEGRARRQAAADRQGRRDGAGEAGRRADLGHDAGDVAGPAGLDRRRVLHVERHDRGLGLVGGGEAPPCRRPARPRPSSRGRWPSAAPAHRGSRCGPRSG